MFLNSESAIKTSKSAKNLCNYTRKYLNKHSCWWSNTNNIFDNTGPPCYSRNIYQNNYTVCIIVNWITIRHNKSTNKYLVHFIEKWSMMIFFCSIHCNVSTIEIVDILLCLSDHVYRLPCIVFLTLNV